MCFGDKSKSEDASPPLNSRPAESKLAGNRNSSKMPDEYAPPPGPPPSHHGYAPPSGPPPNRSEYAPPPGPPPNRSEYAPPPGPPPNRSEYAAPPGPPPNRSEYAPPPGPPPSHSEYAAPPGPPPSHHDWQTAVPDTSLLPPPPSLGNQRSSTNNATEQEAEQGEAWCHHNPMTAPILFPEAALEAIDKGEIGVIKPRTYNGNLERPQPGIWAGKTKSSSPDSCITSTLPLYSVKAHSPLRTGRHKTIYYEVKISSRNRREVSLALGYAAPPYPTFRLPGWHRGCLAVHGDDGSKYINDRWGGKDFTQPFRPGETLGIGMTFTARDLNAPPSYGPAQTEATTPIDVEVFLTRDGRKAGAWNLHEEGDAEEDLPVTGLEGFNDLYAAVGTFENVEFEIVFNPHLWKYHP